VVVATSALHAAASPLLLQAPFVMGFAAWMGSLIGSVLLYLGTRRVLNAGNTGAVLLARTLIPLLAAVLAALVAVVTVASLTGAWEHFWELWAFRWLVAAAAMTTMTALFSVFGLFAFVLAVPLVFYQSLVAGAMAPVTAAPTWIEWLGMLPLRAMTDGVRTLLIGGPADSLQWAGIAGMAGVAVLVTWLGTLLWSRRRRAVVA
jgi:hypothetical protein